MLKCQPADWTSLEISDKTFLAIVPSTGKDPLKEFKGASPIVERIVFTASNSVLLVVVVIMVENYRTIGQSFFLSIFLIYKTNT